MDRTPLTPEAIKELATMNPLVMEQVLRRAMQENPALFSLLIADELPEVEDRRIPDDADRS